MCATCENLLQRRLFLVYFLHQLCTNGNRFKFGILTIVKRAVPPTLLLFV